MALGEWFNRNPAISAVIIIVALGVAAVVTYQYVGGSGGGGQTLEQRYFYDMSSGELLVRANEQAPVTTESGSTAVWATVFSCGDCDNPDEHFIAYLEKGTDELKQEMQKPEGQRDYDLMMEGMRIAYPPENPGDEVQWVPSESPQGMQINESVHGRCTSGVPKPCQPDDGNAS